ncbi:hypothetical protein [Stenotrophomonas sp. SY1]|uniref:hypothetical protein n=1 Tax=Stenotrophomonas sp. SY1 TaxID=477235 RepID=UPI001E4AFA2C|nr:hypothetical protein [Stenotrophomonas sp. SY1]MCD9085603.1 hypothetical protein [Stenotrophomonas sp. SY1]
MKMKADCRQGLSFAALDQRLRDVPDGPAGALNTPQWLKVLHIVAFAGAVLGLAPYFLAKWLGPAQWMVYVAKSGLIILYVAGLPSVLRNCGVMGLQFWHWRKGQAQQLDHDRTYFDHMLAWLTGFSASELTKAECVVRLHLGQLTAKIGFLAGGVERLGMLPVLVSMFLFIRQWKDLLGMPAWQVVLGVFLILLYLVVSVANLMRIRLQLYQALLLEAEKRKATP